MSTTPARPEEAVDAETAAILDERDAIFKREKKAAKPWPEVRAEILRDLKQSAP
jgi:hypothetical protein